MERNSRHKSNSSQTQNSLKSHQESSSRRKDAERRNHYRQAHKCTRDWFSSQVHTEEIGEYQENYWSQHGQRLFAAVSDPAVCGYPVSLGYPVDSYRLSLGFPLYQATPYPPRMPYKEPSSPVIRPGYRMSRINNSSHSKGAFHPPDDYTSLPPGNIPDFQSDHQRRFSDPGLANTGGSDEESGSCNDSLASWGNGCNYSEQIEQLIQENKRLSKELQETQTQLQELKLEVLTWSKTHSSYEPGFISELVREIRDATKQQEELLLDRVRKMILESRSAQTGTNSMAQVKESNSKKEALNERLSRLEEQMKTVMVHNSVQETSRGELLELEKEKLQLRRELQEAVDAKKMAEANASKLERFVASLRKKIPNGLVLEEKTAVNNSDVNGGLSSCNTSESLMSSLGSGSLHSPHVTMSGPVTDL